ncbi:MAG: hypothetical protein PVH84_11675, partial [Candidatus Aminicenantes bacterium]
KICPYCDSEIPDDQGNCPSCGALYWESDDDSRYSGSEEEEEDQGCLTIFALHFLVAAAIFVLLLMVGLVINWLVHFEENQFKVIWTGAALLVAMALSGLIAKLRKKKEEGNQIRK